MILFLLNLWLTTNARIRTKSKFCHSHSKNRLMFPHSLSFRKALLISGFRKFAHFFFISTARKFNSICMYVPNTTFTLLSLLQLHIPKASFCKNWTLNTFQFICSTFFFFQTNLLCDFCNSFFLQVFKMGASIFYCECFVLYFTFMMTVWSRL